METAWLVEKNEKGQPTLYLYVASAGWLTWTEDVDSALRFTRRVDADSIIAVVEDATDVSEHQWGVA